MSSGSSNFKWSPEKKGISGISYDRKIYESSNYISSNDSTISKLQQKYWVTKEAVNRKLGKNQDSEIVDSDRELDMKLRAFASINLSTIQLRDWIESYVEKLCVLSYEEAMFANFLKDYGKANKTEAGKMMVSTSKALSYSAQQRQTIRPVLTRLYQEIDTFKRRAVEDTRLTLREMEKLRTQYRGSLMWMKHQADHLDPDEYKQLEKFRKIQAFVKSNKTRFDKHMLASLQKIDLLSASRSNMFSYALAPYQNSIIEYWTTSAKSLKQVCDTFKDHPTYEFTFIKELAVAPKQNEIHDDENILQSDKRVDKRRKRRENSLPRDAESIIELLDDDAHPIPMGNAAKQQTELQILNHTYHSENGENGDKVKEAQEEGCQQSKKINDMDDLLNMDNTEYTEQNSALPSDLLLGKQQSLDIQARGRDVNLVDFNSQWNDLFGEESSKNGHPQSPQRDGTASSELMNLQNFGGDFNNGVKTPSAATVDNDEEFTALLQKTIISKKKATSDQKTSQTSNSTLKNKLKSSSNYLPMNKNKNSNPKNSPNKGDPSVKEKQDKLISLFAELDPLANPDSVIKSQEQNNCYS